VITAKAPAEDLVPERAKVPAISRVKVKRGQAAKASAAEKDRVRTAAPVRVDRGSQVAFRAELRGHMEAGPRRGKEVVLRRGKEVVLLRDKQAEIRLVLLAAARMVRRERVRRLARPALVPAQAIRMDQGAMSGAARAAVETGRPRVRVGAGKNRAVSVAAVLASDPR
jgi:hypothetical protein